MDIRHNGKYVDCLIIGYPGEEKYKTAFVQELERYDISLPINFVTMYHSRVLMEISLLKNELEGNNFTTTYIISTSMDMDKFDEVKARYTLIVFRYFQSIGQILDVIKNLRRRMVNTKIIVGGGFFCQAWSKLTPHEAKYFLHLIGADFYICQYECSQSVIQIIQKENSLSGLNDIPDIYYLSEGEYIKSRSTISASRVIPKPIKYGELLSSLQPIAAMRTSISCPYFCSFCAVKNRSDTFIKLPISIIQQDVKDIIQVPQVSMLNFIDETINLPQNEYHLFLQMLITMKQSITWFSFIRADQIDEETAILMKKSGCLAVMIGFESGSDILLHAMNKQTTAQKMEQAHRILKKHGIYTIAYFIIGFPGETVETIQLTLQYINNIKPDFYQVNVWSCDVNSDIWLERQHYDLILKGGEWAHKTMNIYQAIEAVTYIQKHVKESINIRGFDITFALQMLKHGIDINTIRKLYKSIRIERGRISCQ